MNLQDSHEKHEEELDLLLEGDEQLGQGVDGQRHDGNVQEHVDDGRRPAEGVPVAAAELLLVGPKLPRAPDGRALVERDDDGEEAVDAQAGHDDKDLDAERGDGKHAEEEEEEGELCEEDGNGIDPLPVVVGAEHLCDVIKGQSPDVLAQPVEVQGDARGGEASGGHNGRHHGVVVPVEAGQHQASNDTQDESHEGQDEEGQAQPEDMQTLIAGLLVAGRHGVVLGDEGFLDGAAGQDALLGRGRELLVCADACLVETAGRGEDGSLQTVEL